MCMLIIRMAVIEKGHVCVRPACFGGVTPIAWALLGLPLGSCAALF